MRLRNLAGLATATSVVLGIVTPGFAVADVSTLYVDNTTTQCTDSGAGAGGQSTPFCTIQAAADAAQPGQTVQVANGYYPETVTITHSGAQGQPITFLGGPLTIGAKPVVGYSSTGGKKVDHGFVLNGVHDVVIHGFTVNTLAEPITLTGTSRVTLDSDTGYTTSAAPVVRVGGNADSTTLIRDYLINGQTPLTGATNVVVVEGGATNTLLTGNLIDNKGGGGGVQVTNSPSTVLTGNSISSLCAPGIALLGDSSKSALENNAVAPAVALRAKAYSACVQPVGPVKVSVSAASVIGTKLDYNLVQPVTGQPAYSWEGAPVGDKDALVAAAGQGAHDLNTDPGFLYGYGFSPSQGSPLIDSADANAIGAVTVDLLGHHRIDDPAVVNTGAGSVSYYDRGAIEFTDHPSVELDPSDYQVPTGAPLTLTTKVGDSWSAPVKYRYDFNDGTPVLETDQPSVQHVYTTAGYKLPTVTVTFANGDIQTCSSYSVQITQPGPIVPKFAVQEQDGALTYAATDAGTTSPWAITSRMYDWGDGGGQVPDTTHRYTRDGDFTVTMYVTDKGGRTAQATQQLHVAYRPSSFHALTPYRALDTRQSSYMQPTLGPGQSLFVPMNGLPGDASAVVLNVTAVNRSGGGYLTVYPAGSDRPSTSNVNFTAKQVVPNLVTVPVGKNGELAVYNRFGDTDVVVDVFGYYSTNTSSGDRYTAQAPVRLLDTRQPGNQPVRAGYASSVLIRGQHGVPADATAAVLNVTATRGTSPSYFSLYPDYTNPTHTSNLNFAPGQTVANQVVVPIGADGRVQLSNFSGSADAVVDLFGYYSPSGESLFRPTTPTRLVDTRTAGHSALGAGGRIAVPTGAPAGATGAVVNLTATAPTASGYLTAWADGADRPGTSNLNFLAGQTVPNHVTTPLSSDGKFDVYNFAGDTQVVADLFGYYTKG